jgi:hypothetical protein
LMTISPHATPFVSSLGPPSQTPRRAPLERDGAIDGSGRATREKSGIRGNRPSSPPQRAVRKRRTEPPMGSPRGTRGLVSPSTNSSCFPGAPGFEHDQAAAPPRCLNTDVMASEPKPRRIRKARKPDHHGAHRVVVFGDQQSGVAALGSRLELGANAGGETLCRRQVHLERRAHADFAVAVEHALVLAHDAIGDGQAEAGADFRGLGREEWLEDAIEYVAAHAGAGIGQADQHVATGLCPDRTTTTRVLENARW